MLFPLNMDKNENQYGPAPECYEVLKSISMEMFNSYSRDYPKRIKEKLSQKFKVKPEHILLGYGSEDILKQCIYFAIKNPGDTLLVPDKSWWYYKHIGQEVKANVVEYHLEEKEDNYDYNDTEIINLLKEKPKAIVLCTPNNPTGNILEPARLEKIIKASDPSTMVILDEAYWGFTNLLKGEEMAQKYDNVIVLRTFSKYYSLAGLRIGFAFVGKSMSELQIYNNRYLGYNRISEEMTFAALDSDDYYSKISKQIMEDAQMLFDELKAMGFKPFKTHANFISVRMPKDIFQFLEKEIPKKEIIIKFFKEDVFEDIVRISIGTREQNQFLVAALKEALQKK